MSKISNEIQNKFSDVVPNIIKEKKFDEQINKASKIFNKLKIIYKNNPEILKNIENEYKDIVNARNYAKSKESIKWETLVAQEYNNLKDEVDSLNTILKIYEEYKFNANNIINNIRIKDWINSQNYKNALNEYNELNKLISLYIQDWKININEFNEIVVEYTKIKKIEYQSKWLISKWFWAITNIFSEKYLEYTKNDATEIIWYKNWDHFLIKISEFEKQINNKNIRITELNQKALASYLEYLNSKWPLNTEILKKYFWKDKLKELWDLWKKHKWETITQKLLKNAWIEKIIEKIISFSDIIKDPESTIPKLKKIPTKEEIQKVPIKDIKEFNHKYSKICPNLTWKDKKVFTEILSLSKIVEIEKKWETKFLKDFNKIIDEKIKEKKLSKEQIQILKEKTKNKSILIFNQWIELLQNPNQACWFELAIFVQNEVDKFLKENNLWVLKEKDRKTLTRSISKTHLEKQILKFNTIDEKIEELKAIKVKTIEQQKELNSLTKQKTEVNKEVIKAKQILTTSQVNNKELERYVYLINKWISKKDAYKDFKENNVNNNIDEKQNIYYETKTHKYPNWEELVYVETPDWYNIDNWIEWNEWIDITKEEFESIKNKPENLKNLLKFKETLSELNIDFIWKHRFDFIKKLNNIDHTLDIKIDEKNYINNTELKKILSWIIILSWNKKPANNLNTIKQALRNISNSWIDSGKKDNKWSPIEKIFINKWIINKDSTTSYFKIDEMAEYYK